MKVHNLSLLFAICSLLFSYEVRSDIDEWIKLTSANFEFYAQYDKERAVAKLKDFEAFRYGVQSMLGMDPNRKLAPVRIYAFSDRNDYNEIKGARNVAGYYSKNGSGPYMVIGPGDLGINDNSTLFHEYLHYLVRAGTNYVYPTWYDEGLASFFGSVEITEDHLIFANRPKKYTKYLKAKGGLSFQTVLNQTNQSKSKDRNRDFVFRFYATSWLAVHYLIAGGVNGEPGYSEQLQKYILLHNQGIKPDEAFVKGFDISPSDFNKKLRGYSKKKRNKALRMARPDLAFDYEIQEISELDVALFYSQLTYGKIPDVSDKYFQIALAGEHSLALAYQANNMARKGSFSDAEKFIDKALESESKTAETYLHVAKAYNAIAEKNHEKAFYTKALIQLLIAEQKRPRAPLFRTMAHTYWQLNMAQKAIDYSVAQYEMAPSDITANLFAADYMMKINELQKAYFLYKNVSNWTHNERLKLRANQYMSQIEALMQKE